jgi:hypothetical protein
MNQVMLLVITVVSTWVAGAQIQDWSSDLLQAPLALPALSELVELPTLSLKAHVLYAATFDDAQKAEESAEKFSKASEKIKKKKASEEEFANLSFKEPNEVKPWREPLGWSAVGVGSAAIIAGGGCLIGWLLEDGKKNPDHDKIDKLKISTIVLASAGAAILITGVVFLLWEEYAPIQTNVAVGPGFAGMSVSGAF